MTQDNINNRIQELYSKYLSGNISRAEYEELFDLIGNESNIHLLEDMIDETLPEYKDSIEEEPVHDSLTSNPSDDFKSGISRRVILFRIAAAAAVLVLVILLPFLWKSSEDQWVVYVTDYQETKNVDLPDGSTVIMNARSELKWKKGLEREERRIVHFTGEGFFDIAHLKDKGFTVKAGVVEVNVLGTEFNLETRREYTNVFLKEGKVVLLAEKEQPVEMEPGDMVHYDIEKKEISKVKNLPSQSALSWKEGVFTFLDLTGIQILKKMEDIYGKEFIIEEPGQLSDLIVVQGLPYTDWEFTRQALELALGVKLQESTENKIIVKIK